VTALRVKDLSVTYGRVLAIRGLNLTLDAGESLLLLGPNGAGKTSAVEAIAGLLPKQSGIIEFFGSDITGASVSDVVRKGLALVPQWRELFRDFSVEETLLAATTAARGRTPTPMEQIYDLFPVLRERRKQVAGSLSGGEQQMLAIGRALVTNPKLLILDEPSAGLASGITRLLIQSIIRIRDGGVSILLVEQNMEIARAVGGRCCILAAGKLVWEGTMKEATEDDAAMRHYFGRH
jgi:branched-chain amino acid transport system ATP-binding protein